jgi:ParB-like chromosome segregation protein Spo0J
MKQPVKIGFEHRGVMIPIDEILPLKKVKPQTKKTKKYHQISASIREVGVVEHLIVCPQNVKTGGYMLLDGHIRLEVLKDIGQKEVFCLISTDDEGFTYNHKVNRLSAIQEHFMILKAIEKGVSEERIAKTLNVNVVKIREKRNLLKGICPEVVELLKDKLISPNAFRTLRKMTAIRQIEAAELMISSNNYTVPYTQALLAATSKGQLVEQQKPKNFEGLSAEGLALMEKEAAVVEKDFRIVKDSYGKDILNLVLASGYLTKLLNNDRIVRYLSDNYSDILFEFKRIIKAISLET